MGILKSPTLAVKGKLHTDSVVGVSVILCSNCCVEQREHWEKARYTHPRLGVGRGSSHP